MPLEPLAPVRTVHLIRQVDGELIPLLRGLEPEDWQRATVGHWAVRDVVAHLLDGALRRLSLGRDGHLPTAPDRDLSDYKELVGFLNDLNAIWVQAADRLSPQVLTDLLEQVCPQVADYFESLDPQGQAPFPVSWAGADSSKVWMDVAREYTERWHHQQQIREAVGAPGLDQEEYVIPLLATFVRALPRSYSRHEAPTGTRVEVRISDLENQTWVLERLSDSWQLGAAATEFEADTVIELAAESAWRLFTKAITGSDARDVAHVTGREQWAEPFFTSLAIMA